MFAFSAYSFFWGGLALRTITGDCMMGCAVVTAQGPGFEPGQELDPKAREKALDLLPAIERTFRSIGLLITAATTQELIDELRGGDPRSFDWLISQSDAVERLAKKELDGKLFLYVAPERARYWPQNSDPNPFGDLVADAFPSVSFDIQNASMCMACGLSTAAVFHLMRVMEAALAVLGAKFDVSLEHTIGGEL